MKENKEKEEKRKQENMAAVLFNSKKIMTTMKINGVYHSIDATTRQRIESNVLRRVRRHYIARMGEQRFVLNELIDDSGRIYGIAVVCHDKF